MVDRNDFRLRFYQNLKLASTTKSQLACRALKPPQACMRSSGRRWTPPGSSPTQLGRAHWRARPSPPAPKDPLKARFMAFNGGAGIHGIDPSEYSSNSAMTPRTAVCAHAYPRRDRPLRPHSCRHAGLRRLTKARPRYHSPAGGSTRQGASDAGAAQSCSWF